MQRYLTINTSLSTAFKIVVYVYINYQLSAINYLSVHEHKFIILMRRARAWYAREMRELRFRKKIRRWQNQLVGKVEHNRTDRGQHVNGEEDGDIIGTGGRPRDNDNHQSLIPLGG